MRNYIHFLKPTILTRHLLVSFLAPFLIGELFFSFVILLFNMRQVIQAVIEKNIEISLLAQLSLYSMGWTLGMTIPMSALLAIILSVSTLNADQEIIVMRASGIHYSRIFRPYLIFSIVIAFLMMWYQLNAVPYCMRMVNVVVNKIANYNPTALIEAGQFTALDEQASMSRNMYVDAIDEDEINKRTLLRGIQIRKVERVGGLNRLTELVFARSGEKVLKTMPNGSKIKALRLYNGFVYIHDGKSEGFEKLNFNDEGYMDINMKDNFTHIDSKSKPTMIEYSPSQLLDEIKTYSGLENPPKEVKTTLKKLQTEYYKRTALPFATIFFVLCGFPLGIVNKRSGKGVGFGQAILIIFIYFPLYLAADALANQTTLFSPFAAAWIGNFLIMIAGLVLYTLKTTEIFWKFYRK